MEQEKETRCNMPCMDAEWRSCIEKRMQALEEKQDANNEMTQRIKEILEYADGFFKFCKGVGWILSKLAKLAGWGLAIYGAFYAITHGGKQP